jgi:Ca2+:H+ antiporter
MHIWETTWPRYRWAGRLDWWLWAGTLASGLISAVTYYGHAGPEAGFFTALVALAFSAAVMGRAIDQVAGRLSAGAVGLFQTAAGNLPELIIGSFALAHGLNAVVQGTIAGAVLNMLLFGNGLAFICGGCDTGRCASTWRARRTPA